MLPLPDKSEKLAPINFSVGAGLVHRLGRESVSDPVLSVVELVKNSYDDDAEQVIITLRNLRTGIPSITIEDDGNAMTSEQLTGRWMRIATNYKVREPRSPKFKRIRLGQKGVGRFAVENLSKKTIITSYPRNTEEGYEIEFDWDSYKHDLDISKVPNNTSKFPKDPKINGLKIQLLDLQQRWLETDVKRLLSFLAAMIPPAESFPNFRITVNTDEFDQLKGTVNSSFLKTAVFVFDASLSKTGEMSFKLDVPNKGIVRERKAKLEDFTCGPVDFRLYFYYRAIGKLADYGVKIQSLDDLTAILDNFGGIRIYRDDIRLSGFGNPDDDWTGLDAMARNDPTVIPGRNQIIGVVKITSNENPEITETTTRENLIRNQSFQDMLKFVRDSIGVFSELRGEIEQKRQPAPTQGSTLVKKARQNIKNNAKRKELLDFSDKYPQTFYKRLEEEINLCYTTSLPNASLVLSRKMVENLFYEILERKFPREIELRYIVSQGRAQDFATLINNLEIRISDFDREQQDIVKALLQRIKPFRREANSTTHRVMEYLDALDDLDRLKIPEIIEIELQLIRKIIEGQTK
jgi:hypothetical protein